MKYQETHSYIIWKKLKNGFLTNGVFNFSYEGEIETYRLFEAKKVYLRL